MPRKTRAVATIEVILLESDRHLGEKYEVVRVKPIFAKNVLLPKNMAVLANAGNLNKYKQKMEAAEAQRAKKASGFADMIAKVSDSNGLVFEKKANEKGALYSKIDAKEIAQKLSDDYGINVDEQYIKMKKKLSTNGEFKVPFKYKELERDLHIIVKAIMEKPAKTGKTVETPVEEVVEETAAA